MGHLLVNYPKIIEHGGFGDSPFRRVQGRYRGITPSQFIKNIRERGLVGKDIVLKDVEPEIQEQFAELIRQDLYFELEELSRRKGVKPDPEKLATIVEDHIQKQLREGKFADVLSSGYCISRLGLSLSRRRIDKARRSAYRRLEKDRDWEVARNLDEVLGYKDGKWKGVAKRDVKNYLKKGDLVSAVWVVGETGIQVDFKSLESDVQRGFEGILNNAEWTLSEAVDEIVNAVEVTGIKPSQERFGERIETIRKQLDFQGDNEALQRLESISLPLS